MQTTPIKILLVDDDDVDREHTRRLLYRVSLATQITEAKDRQEAHAVSEVEHFDCVLLDYHLPGAEGLELVDEFASETTAVVMLTGLGNEAVAVGAMKRGAKDYLVKGLLSPDDLKRAILNATEKLRLEQAVRDKNRRLEQLSLHDSLTNLPNRNLFQDRLELTIRSAKRGNQKFAALMMDLDLFKEINDNFGHKFGDELLRIVAERLSDTLRDSDTVARLGGDEFAALLPSIHSLEGAAVLAERLHASISNPMAVEGQVLEVGLSIGIGLFPDHGTTAESLMHAADLAMYEAKKASKGFAVCERDLESRSAFEILLPKRLEDGLRRDEFLLYYQPKVDLQTGRISGAEALVRWKQPEVGLLPPMEFIPGAERTALIRPLTMRTLEMAARQAASLQKAGSPLPISVNLSPRLLTNKSLPEEILDVWVGHDLAPPSLTLEITESGIVANVARGNDMLQKLADLGLGIAIDDFGTGYTSLRYLRELPLTEIKIDKLFVHDLQHERDNGSIVRSVIDLSLGLGLDVVAEGIETDETRQELHALGCRFGQGYAIARPMPADELEDFLAKWNDGIQPSVEPQARANYIKTAGYASN